MVQVQNSQRTKDNLIGKASGRAGGYLMPSSQEMPDLRGDVVVRRSAGPQTHSRREQFDQLRKIRFSRFRTSDQGSVLFGLSR
jgi:hypothetical protein